MAKTKINSNQINSNIFREILTANRTYYVRKDGSDSNTGLADNAGGAFLTIQKAVDIAAMLDISIYNVTIQVRTGTYIETVTFKNAVGAGSILVLGDATTPSNVVIDGGVIKTSSGTPYSIQGFDFFKNTTANTVAIAASGYSLLGFANCRFRGSYQFHISASRATINCFGNYEIAGSCQNHLYSNNQANIQIISKTVTLTGTPNFTSSFLQGQNLGLAVIANNTYVGSATGSRYNMSSNSVAQTNGATLPGNTNGSIITGGVYY